MTKRLLSKASPATMRASLLGAAALAAFMTVGAALPANAASAPTSEEVQMLRQQLEVLAARVAAQEAALQQAQAAQAQAAAQIDTIPTQVQSAVAALPPPVAKASWADKTKVSGRMYYNVSNINYKSDGVKMPPTGTGFEIKRFYIGIDHKFNDVFSGNVTTDFQYAPAISATELYIKKAYLQAKLSDAFVVRVGATDLPWVPFAESAYGYRYVENTLIDHNKFGTSSDWGVHASGEVGMFNYAIAVLDGAGYKKPLRSKGMDVEARVSVEPIEGVTLGIGGYAGKLGKDIQGVTTYHTATRFNALAAYKVGGFGVGVEYFSAEDWNNVTTVASDSAEGYSVFASYKFNDQVSVFGRYDHTDPSKDVSPATENNYFNIGAQYSAYKNVDFSLVYKRDKVENGFMSTSNGTIGGVNQGTYDEIGVFGQFRF